MDPGDPIRLGRLGNALKAIGNLGDAEVAYRRGLVIDRHSAPMLGALGNVFADRGQLAEARRLMFQAMEINPDLLLIYRALAVVARRAGNAAGAIDAFRLGLVQCPQSMVLAIDHGNAVSALEEHGTALKSFRRAWILLPGTAAAANNIARAASELNRPQEARLWFRRALVLDPALDAAQKSIGNELKFLADAASGFKWLARAVILAPRNFDTTGDLLFAANYLIGMTATKLRHLHERYCAAYDLAAPMPVRAVGTRLKVGFSSPDFSIHPVGYFIVGLFEHHDPSAIQFHCLSDTPRPDGMTQRLRAGADGWEDTRHLDHSAWLDFARSTDVSILVDLAGHTRGGRLPAIARRAAPIQVAWIGYPSTTGIPAVDFLLADRFQIPKEEDQAYCEQVVRTPNGYITYALQDAPSPANRDDGEKDDFIFASFNNPAKINRPLVDLWGTVLRRIPRSRLLLKYKGYDDPELQSRLFAWFRASGIAADRLILEGMAPRAAMLARYRDVDLVLDTAPYSGGATTCEAIAMGVPVVTFPGATFASRHSASHLASAGMPELVAANADAYTSLAVDLASDHSKLREVKAALAKRLVGSPHRDHAGFARDFTRIMTDMANGRL